MLLGPVTLSTTTLYIRNLPLNVTMEELQVAFETYGVVKGIRIQKEKTTGEFFGYNFLFLILILILFLFFSSFHLSSLLNIFSLTEYVQV